ncbi:MAG TPA: M13 family metallopeptidase [Xanthomonadales bacterium]
MNYKLTITLTALLGLYGCQQEADQAAATAQAEQNSAQTVTEVAAVTSELVSGIDQSGFDESVRPQDDFFDYVNGAWVKETEMPSDKARWGTFDALGEQSQRDVRTLVEEVSTAEGVEAGTPTQKIRDFYNSYMDAEAATAKGVEAIRSDLEAIAAITNLDGVYSAFSSLGMYGVNTPIGLGIFSDMKDPDVNAIYVVQAGLTLPDRDYYLKDDEQFVKGRQLYLKYVTDVFDLAGFENGSDRAERLLDLETKLAEVMWTKEENRDWSKRYNPMNIDQLNQMAPQINWAVGFESAQIPIDSTFLVSQPSYFEAAGKILSDTPLETWKDYLSFQTISTFAPVLGEQFSELSFNFFDKGLSGVDEQEPRWKRAVDSVNENMGELLGQLYVERHFQAESKARMDTMIQNLIKAYEVSILDLDWMSEETKQQALDKLHKFTPKIGYPDKWIDYTKLEVVDGDLITNIKNGRTFAYNREIDKLDKPVDKTEWGMTPQTVNAYYNPVWNEIVFPASILQPPFFNVLADDAVNYGGIGAVIGHEIGHGFDDSGKRFDGDGVLRDWWTAEDAEKFDVRKNALAAQYDGYDVIDGLTINGQFTSGENIGDLGGLSIAYLAYKMSLDGKEAPVIDGWTGDQRFFLGWAQVWRSKARDEETKRRLTVDPHSPPKFRANGAAVNVPAFYEAFDVKEGDGMYLPPEERVKIW